MSNIDKGNKTTVLVLDQKIIAGVDKYLANVPKVTLAGVDYTPTTLKAVFQGSIDATNALDGLRTQLKQQVAVDRTERAKMRVVRKALRSMLLGTFGSQAVQVLEDFGMSVPKTSGAKTVKAKAEAVNKAETTRNAKKHPGATPVATTPAAPPATPPAASVSATPPKP